MQLRFVLFLFAVSVCAQTTLRLRYGGHLSGFRVTAISGATPAVVTVQDARGVTGHTLSAGDSIYIHSVPGCVNANGYQKVGATVDQGAGTFTLVDAGNDDPITCTAAFQSQWGSGWVGKVQTYTLNSSPRLFLPQSGDIKTRMTDPDGSGPLVAPVVTENGPAWQGLITRAVSANILDTACDGETDAACPNAALKLGRIYPFQTYDDFTVQGVDILGLAAVWYADNSKTNYLAAAKFYLNNYHRVPTLGYLNHGSITWLNVPGFPCDTTAVHCGLSSGADWISFNLLAALYGFDLIRDQLTSGQRSTFAEKILNGWDGGSCTNTMEEMTGTISTTAGSPNVTGSGFSAYSPGSWIYIGVAPRTTGRVNVVQSVASDSAMTLYRNLDVTKADVKHYRINAWATGSCGALNVAGGHLEHVGAAVPRGATTLAANITAGATTLTVASAANFLDAAPFVIYLEQEAMRVTEVVGTTLTVERGYWGTTAATHSSGRILTWSRHPGSVGPNTSNPPAGAGPFIFTGQWSSNVHQQKQHGYLIAGLALADIDSRAVTLAEQMWNFFYDLTYPYNKDYWSGPTQGGTTQGYMVGRFNGNNYPYTVLAGEHAFTVPNSINEDYLWRYLELPIYYTVPGFWNSGPGALVGSDPWTTRYWYSVGFASYLAPSAATTAYANYWFKNLASLHNAASYYGSTGVRGAAFAAAYIRPTDTETDFRSAVNPWKAFTATDFDRADMDGSAFGMWVSKTDFGSSATAVYSSLGFWDSRDHNLDYPYIPGSYHVYRGNRLFISDDAGSGFWGNISTSTNYFEVGSASELRRQSNQPAWFGTASCDGGIRATIDRTGGSADYTHARGNFLTSYCSTTGAQKAFRYIVHLKGTREYVLVYDSFATSGAKSMTARVNYFRRDDAVGTWARVGNGITFGKTAKSMATQFLYPAGASPTLTDSSSSNAYRVTVAFGSVTSAELLAVHGLSDSTGYSLPTTTMLATTDSNHRVVQIDETGYTRIVSFGSTEGRVSEASFTSGHTSAGGCLVTGLLAGNYYVFRNSVQQGGAIAADGGGAVWFSCTGDSSPVAWLLTRNPAVPPTITTTTLPGGTVGLAYSQTLSASGDTPITWSVVSGTLCGGLSLGETTGTISGVPTTAQTCNFTARATNIEGYDDQALSIVIAAIPGLTNQTVRGGEIRGGGRIQ